MIVNTILQHTLSILLHGHLIDLKQEHGFQWSVVAVKVNSHCTRRDASRYIALRRVASYNFF